MVWFFFPDLSLSSSYTASCKTEHKISAVALLMLSGVGEAVHVLQALFLSVHLSVMFVFFTTTWCCWLMFSLNRLFPPHPFVKNCYLTSSSLSCIYVNDYSFLCCTCTYWISSHFLQIFSPLYWSSSSVHPSFMCSVSSTFLNQAFNIEPKKYSCRTPFNA